MLTQSLYHLTVGRVTTCLKLLLPSLPIHEGLYSQEVPNTKPLQLRNIFDFPPVTNMTVSVNTQHIFIAILKLVSTPNVVYVFKLNFKEYA